MKALIHYHRPGKGETLFTETLVGDDGEQVNTFSIIDPEIAAAWVRNTWVPAGLLTDEKVIATVRKHLFYKEWFSIMQLFDPDGNLLGSYCDMLTPLQKRGGEYYLTDLFLDLWVAPDGTFIELDWDEYAEAVSHEIITPEQAEMAVQTMHRLVAEARQGRFPPVYQYKSG